MLPYALRRLLLIVPTLLGIMVLNFIIVQAAPGGPVERTMAKLYDRNTDATARLSGNQAEIDDRVVRPGESGYRGSSGMRAELIKQLETMYGFDRPPVERFFLMMGNYLRLDFGKSFYRDQTVLDLVVSKLPVSISLGLWSLILIYGISIPLGIAKAVRDGSRFDVATSLAIIVGYAIPAYLFAVALVILFAGGSYFSWFPLRGLTSDNWDQLGWGARILDYLWHMVLPILSLVISGFASLTMLTKNSFIEEIGKQYVTTARAKGAGQNRVLYGHIFRNAMLVVIASFPAAFVSILFTGSLLIEVIFSLDGIGLLGFEATVNRDYPVMFGTLFIFTLIGLVLNLIGDLTYMLIDPRIDFERRT